jgi:hypothetical protein
MIETAELLPRRLETARWLTSNPTAQKTKTRTSNAPVDGPDCGQLKAAIGTPERTAKLTHRVSLTTEVRAAARYPVAG